MSILSTNDDDRQLQSRENQRSAGSELLTKIYYPDTLYPDNYRFFTDRQSSQGRSSLWMDVNDQNPNTDSIKPMSACSQGMIDIETSEEQNKYSVSILLI